MSKLGKKSHAVYEVGVLGRRGAAPLDRPADFKIHAANKVEVQRLIVGT